MSEFDDATALTAHPDGTYSATLSDDWSIGDAVNGGLLMSLAAKAVSDAAADHHPHPLTFSAVFLSPGAPGAATVAPTLLRTGRSMSTAEVVVSQDGTERLRALVTMGDVSAQAEPIRKQTPMPVFAPIEECIAADNAPPSLAQAGLLKRFDLLMDPETVGWAMGQPSGDGEMRAWIRFADGHEADPVALLTFLDALPPVAFDLGAQGWVPTVEFTGYVRAVPAPGPLAVRLRTSTVTGNLLEEDAEIWDSTGRLVAQSRQLASARFPA